MYFCSLANTFVSIESFHDGCSVLLCYFGHYVTFTLVSNLSSLRTTLCVRFKSEVVACGVVYAAARRFQVPLPENPPWWKAFDADKSGIDEVCRVLAHLYSLPKSQYIPVCKEGGSFSTTSKSWDPQPMPKVNLPSYHISDSLLNLTLSSILFRIAFTYLSKHFENL